MFGLRLIKRSLKRARKKRAPDKNYLAQKETARRIISDRVATLSLLGGVSPKRIAIRNTKRNWGSCSSLGNLNFNYKVALLPACLRDYIIIHELCHLVHLNHKPEYWAEVERHCADYLVRINAVREVERVTNMKATAISEYSKGHQCDYCTQVMEYTQP